MLTLHLPLSWRKSAVFMEKRACADTSQSFGPEREDPKKNQNVAGTYVNKPMGFSWFPKELVPTPRSWIETQGNLVHFSQHTSGGHFAALEKPRELLNDVEDFVKVAWKR